MSTYAITFLILIFIASPTYVIGGPLPTPDETVLNVPTDSIIQGFYQLERSENRFLEACVAFLKPVSKAKSYLYNLSDRGGEDTPALRNRRRRAVDEIITSGKRLYNDLDFLILEYGYLERYFRRLIDDLEKNQESIRDDNLKTVLDEAFPIMKDTREKLFDRKRAYRDLKAILNLWVERAREDREHFFATGSEVKGFIIRFDNEIVDWITDCVMNSEKPYLSRKQTIEDYIKRFRRTSSNLSNSKITFFKKNYLRHLVEQYRNVIKATSSTHKTPETVFDDREESSFEQLYFKNKYFNSYKADSQRGEFDTRLGLQDRVNIWKAWKVVKHRLTRARGEEKSCFSHTSCFEVMTSSLLPGYFIFPLSPGYRDEDYDERAPSDVIAPDECQQLCAHWQGLIQRVAVCDSLESVFSTDMSHEDFNSMIKRCNSSIDSEEKAIAICRGYINLTRPGIPYFSWDDVKSDLLTSSDERDDYYQEVKSVFANPSISKTKDGGFALVFYLYCREYSSMMALKINRNGTVERVQHEESELE